FDVVYVMTSGNYNTDVLAYRMYNQLYTAGNSGGASAVAIILLIAVVPVLIFNLRQFRAVEARRRPAPPPRGRRRQPPPPPASRTVCPRARAPSPSLGSPLPGG